MKPKYTKGPWKVSCQFGGATEIKSFHTITDSENRLFVALADTRASANLIAAAPEMLEALENALAWIDRSHKYGSDMESSRLSCLLDASGILSDAIKKARGES